MQNFWKEINEKTAVKSSKKQLLKRGGKHLRIAVHEIICRHHSQTQCPYSEENFVLTFFSVLGTLPRKFQPSFL